MGYFVRRLDRRSKSGQTYTGIDPPSVQLLAVHRAICPILHLSAAGNYINSTLRDMDDGTVQANGSTRLG